jgi:hypothetical protein
MTWIYVTIPLMVIATAIATLPLIHLIVREERAHRTTVPDAVHERARPEAYWTRPGPVRTERSNLTGPIAA